MRNSAMSWAVMRSTTLPLMRTKSVRPASRSFSLPKPCMRRKYCRQGDEMLNVRSPFFVSRSSQKRAGSAWHTSVFMAA